LWHQRAFLRDGWGVISLQERFPSFFAIVGWWRQGESPAYAAKGCSTPLGSSKL
jgi:hypothetical protein